MLRRPVLSQNIMLYYSDAELIIYLLTTGILMSYEDWSQGNQNCHCNRILLACNVSLILLKYHQLYLHCFFAGMQVHIAEIDMGPYFIYLRRQIIISLGT